MVLVDIKSLCIFFVFTFRFMVKLDQQHAKEVLLLTKWNQKSKTIDGTISAIEQKLNSLNAEPINETSTARLVAELEVFIQIMV